MFLWVAVWGVVLPFLMNTAGWLLTESGRQPWIVQGIMLTKNGISPTVSTTWLWISVLGIRRRSTARSAPSTCCSC